MLIVPFVVADGFLVWILNRKIPKERNAKQILNSVVAADFGVWLLFVLSLFNSGLSILNPEVANITPALSHE